MDDYSRISHFEAILLQFSGERLPGIQMNEESAKQLADDMEETRQPFPMRAEKLQLR